MNADPLKESDRELLELLRDYPAPEPDAGFYERALIRATHEVSRRLRNRRLLTGFGAAVAATLAVWVGGGLPGSPELDVPAADIPGVTIALAEPRTINLVFASATALDNAMLTVSLPVGVELAGFPGQREITWETSLDAGRNLLPLTLVALGPAGGELQARLDHDDRKRTFRLRVDVNRNELEGTSS